MFFQSSGSQNIVCNIQTCRTHLRNDVVYVMCVAPHSSTPAWKIPWMEEPGGLQSMGSLRVGHD